MERPLFAQSPASLPLPSADIDGAAPRRWDALVRLVATSLAVPPADLMSPSRRSARAAFARQVAMYLAHVCFGATFSAVGRAFGRDRTTAAHAVRVVEERRDDPCIDALLERIEQACAGLADTPACAGLADTPACAGLADTPACAGLADTPACAGLADTPADMVTGAR